MIKVNFISFLTFYLYHFPSLWQLLKDCLYVNKYNLFGLITLCNFVFLGEALFALRSSLRASPQQLSDWNLNQVDPCTWSQVICDEQKHVTSLYVSQR